MATTKDNEAAAAAGLAVPVNSAEEYMEAVKGQNLPPATADATETSIGWTAQSVKAYVEPAQQPGQLFTPDQLPDPQVAIRAGFPAQVIPEHLIIGDEEDNPQGPEPWEIGADPREIRGAVRERVVAEKADFDKQVEEVRVANSGETTTKKATTSTSKSSS